MKKKKTLTQRKAVVVLFKTKRINIYPSYTEANLCKRVQISKRNLKLLQPSLILKKNHSLKRKKNLREKDQCLKSLTIQRKKKVIKFLMPNRDQYLINNSNKKVENHPYANQQDPSQQ